jgi:uncharacterized membrane protein YbhN (UPF0104 family)
LRRLCRIAVPGLPVKRDLIAAAPRLLADSPNTQEVVLLRGPKPRGETRRRLLVLAMLALAAAGAVPAASEVAGIGPRLSEGRPAWLILAAGFELISAFGFVAAFQVVFGEWLPKRMILRMGLAVRAATILLPAGGLVAIGAGAGALRRRGMPSAKTVPRTIAFLVITNAPNLIVLGGLGIALGAGLLDGPHGVILTIVPATIALSAIALTVFFPNLSHQRMVRAPRRFPQLAASVVARQLELGVIEARALVSGRSWKLLGAFTYYAFDNAVLWATFKAFGHTRPPTATLVMAYLIGSAAGSLPAPAGIGVVEGGMIGLFVLYGAPAICAGIAVLAYRAVSTGLPLALGGVALLALGQPAPRRRRDDEAAGKARKYERGLDGARPSGARLGLGTWLAGRVLLARHRRL